MLVLQPRSFLFWTAFTTGIARSWPDPVPVWLTRAIGACASEWIVRSPGISRSNGTSYLTKMSGVLIINQGIYSMTYLET
jgi:hypothetical protein